MAKKSSFFKDFKAFISKGNILDMAVGVVIGSAFGKIVSSLVADIITPLISLAMGNINLTEQFIALNPDAKGMTVAAAQEAGYAILTYGNFLQAIIDFLLIAFCIFVALRVIVKVQSKANAKKLAEAEAAAAEAKAAADAAAAEAAAKQAALEESTLKQAELLAEIRDLLKKK